MKIKSTKKTIRKITADVKAFVSKQIRLFDVEKHQKLVIREFKKYRAKSSHLIGNQMNRMRALKGIGFVQFVGVEGPKELMLFSIIILGAVVGALVRMGVSPALLFFSWALIASFGVAALYGASISKQPWDILVFVPFRILLAFLLVIGYVLLVMKAISVFQVSALSLGLILSWGAAIFGYMFLTPILYKVLSRLVSHMAVSFLRVRPYFELHLKGEYVSERFLKPDNYPLVYRFLSKGIRGILVYPDEPLFSPAIRQIKRRLGDDIISVSFAELSRIYGKREFTKYFELIEILRPEIRDLDNYHSMFPFVTLIKDDSIKEFDLGTARTSLELDQLIIAITKEKTELRIDKKTAPVNIRWYDTTLKTFFAKRPWLYAITFLTVGSTAFLLFKLPLNNAAVTPAVLMLLVDVAVAGRGLYSMRLEPADIEVISGK